ncbi:MAG: hypothetical protein FWC84_05650 [Alphaproteobacteria bacterium]|nr:hypothetical protein [Alphaproteobacteria bacterium]
MTIEQVPEYADLIEIDSDAYIGVFDLRADRREKPASTLSHPALVLEIDQNDFCGKGMADDAKRNAAGTAGGTIG